MKPIGHISQIPPGEGRNVEVDGEVIAIFHTRTGEVFATQPRCPHRQGPLADGLLGGTTLVCPLHEMTFDLRTGQAVSGDCRLLTYPVRTDADGRILLEQVTVSAE